MGKKFLLFDIYWDQKEIDTVTNVIKRGSYWSIGPEIREFEERLEKYLNCKYVVTFNSGTSALHSVLLAYNINSGDVIVPSFTFISTANCIILAGAKPVFSEIEESTLGLDHKDVLEKINKKTKAIIPVHYGGRTCRDIQALKEIAEDYNLLLIEDNAESLGAKKNDSYAGTFGNASMLSFCQNKIITTGEGGAICTNDADVYKKLLLIRSHGRVEAEGTNYFSSIKEMDYIQIGYNYRMPTISAALGVAQLDKIEDIIRLRRKIGKYYDDQLKDISELKIIPEIDGYRNVYQLYSVFLNSPKRREEFQEYLVENGIYTKVYFHPIHLKTYYKEKFGYNEGSFPITEEISSKILSLPVSLRFSQEDQNYIINTIKDFFNKS